MKKTFPRLVSLLLVIALSVNVLGVSATSAPATLNESYFIDNNGNRVDIVTKENDSKIVFEAYQNGKLIDSTSIDKKTKIVTADKGKTKYDPSKEVKLISKKDQLNQITSSSMPAAAASSSTIYDETTDKTYNYFTSSYYSDMYTYVPGLPRTTQVCKVYLNQSTGVSQYTVNAQGKTVLTIATLLISAISLPTSSMAKLTQYLLSIVFAAVVSTANQIITKALFPTIACNYEKNAYLGIGMQTQYRCYQEVDKYTVIETGKSQGTVYMDNGYGTTSYDGFPLPNNFNVYSAKVKLWLAGAYL